MSVQIHAAPVFAPARIQENTPGELFMYWFRARGCFHRGAGDKLKKIYGTAQRAFPRNFDTIPTGKHACAWNSIHIHIREQFR